MERAFRDPVFTSDNYGWQLEPVHGRTLLQMSGREHSARRALVAKAEVDAGVGQSLDAMPDVRPADGFARRKAGSSPAGPRCGRCGSPRGA
jgi:hypothetical protein